jgi:hypothetical protein
VSERTCGDAGWLHTKLKGEPITKKIRKRKTVPINWYNLQALYSMKLPDKLPEYLENLRNLGLGYDGDAYTIPMFKCHEICGMQRVWWPSRDKAMIKGSKMGLFMSGDNQDSPYMIVTEGVSDTGIADKFRYCAVGVPSANSCKRYVVGMAVDFELTIIIADNDEPGLKSAKNLSLKLLQERCNNIIIVPPCKDLREWVENESLSTVQKKIEQKIDDYKEYMG